MYSRPPAIGNLSNLFWSFAPTPDGPCLMAVDPESWVETSVERSFNLLLKLIRDCTSRGLLDLDLSEWALTGDGLLPERFFDLLVLLSESGDPLFDLQWELDFEWIGVRHLKFVPGIYLDTVEGEYWWSPFEGGGLDFDLNVRKCLNWIWDPDI